MQLERLVIEAGDHTFTLSFDARLTVISGIGPLEREGLLSELLTAMGPGREGVHLQVTSDGGNRFTVFRPAGGPAKVIDLDSSRDVTASFEAPRRPGAPAASVDLLARAGLDARSARRHMLVTSTDLGTKARDDHRLSVLAALDQHRLWDVARKVRERQERLAAEAAEAGSSVGDAETIGEIERRHQEFEAAEAEHERSRRRSLLVAANLTLLAVPLATVLSPAVAFATLAGGAAVGGISFRTWRRMEEARRNEQQALAATGNDSYLAFHLHRVHQLMTDDLRRKALLRASDDLRAAMLEWQVMAGEIPVDWAWDHRSEVRAASGVASPAGADDGLGEITAVMLARLARLRQLGPGGESFPAIFDEAFTDVPTEGKPALLDRLRAAAGRQQVIVLTDDADVTGWARREARAGRATLVEPARRATADGAGDGASNGHSGRRRSGHKVA